MIEGEKVLLCGLTSESFFKTLEWANLPELRLLSGTLYPVSEFEHKLWIENKSISSSEKVFLIKEKSSLEDIGTIGLRNIDWTSRNAELWIKIGNTEYISGLSKNGMRGYGGDAVKTLCSFCFNSMNLHKIYLHVFESNERAKRCYEKVGFIIEGTLKEHHFSNGRYENVLVMSRLR